MKKFGLAFGAPIILLIAGLLIAPSFIDAAKFKAPVIKQVEAATGYELGLGDHISLQLFPLPKISVDNVTVASPGQKPFATIGELDVGVALMPLIHGAVDVDHVTLSKPNIMLNVDKSGKNNWTAAKPQVVEKKVTEKPSGEVSAVRQVSIKSFKIDGGQIRYTNAQTGDDMLLQDVTVDAAMPRLSSPLNFVANAKWNEQATSVKAKIDNLQSIIDGKATAMEISASNALFNLASKGKLESLQYKGNISVSSPSLKAVQHWLKPKAAPIDVPTQLSLKLDGTANCGPAVCAIDGAKLNLDAMNFSGNVKAIYGTSKPSITANLESGALDLSPYIKADKHAALSLVSKAYAADSRWSDDPIDLSGLNAIAADIQLKAQKIIANQFVLEHPLIKAAIQGGKANFSLAGAEIFGGKMDVAGTATTSKTPTITGQFAIANCDIASLGKALAESDRVSGKGNVKLNIVTSGSNQRAMVQNLSGSGTLGLADGAVRGIDIAGLIRNIKTGRLVQDNKSEKTDFSSLNASFAINRGIITNNDLVLKAPLLRVGGKGEVNLPNYTVNYRLVPSLVETAQGQGGKEKEGLAVPILVEGPLDHPSYMPDVASIAEEALKDPEKLKSQIKDIKAQFKDKNSLKNLRNLLKGKPNAEAPPAPVAPIAP